MGPRVAAASGRPRPTGEPLRTARGADHYPEPVEDLDRRIVDLLAKDGRISYTDLGKALGMSTSAVHQRVRRLEQRGVVKGYTARLDHQALGQQITAFISITPLDPAAPDDIPDRLRDIGAIEECHSVAGDEN